MKSQQKSESAPTRTPRKVENLIFPRERGEKPQFQDGADGGGRTHTTFRLLDFESSASANSATSAKPEEAGYQKGFCGRKQIAGCRRK